MKARGFASDNNAPVHPSIMKALEQVNHDHCIAYGDDPYTLMALDNFRKLFGNQVEVFFVFTGTAANVLGLSAATAPFNAVICAETAHIHVDECGAPEKFTGCKLLPLKSPNGKLTVDMVAGQLHGIGFEHHVQPRVVSITQATEVGTIYSNEEIKTIAEFAHRNSLLLHVDGARIANAAVSLNCSMKEMITDTGVDVLSFGGTKNGMMFGEAIVFLKPELALDFKYRRKQGMQLASKMRYISAQFNEYISTDLWISNATHANKMAQMLEVAVKEIPGIKVTQNVQANGVFAIIPEKIIPALREEFFFYTWDEGTSEVRWMCSFDTTEEDIVSFAAVLRKLMKNS